MKGKVVARKKKTRWTEAEWIAFGNRVKHVRNELGSMMMDMQHVCNVPQMDGLRKVEKYLDRWRSSMENVAARDLPGEILTRVFYGDVLPVSSSSID